MTRATDRATDRHGPMGVRHRYKPAGRLVLLGVLILAFLAFSLPPYLGGDPADARIPLRADVPYHHAALVVHVLTASVAMLAVWPQVWPWLRRTRPRVHKAVGRVYVFAGVLPATATALLITPFSAGPVGNAVNAVLWLTTTLIGVAMARRGRLDQHRRFMLYSFALTLAVIWGRLMLMLLPFVPAWTVDHLPHTLETATWLGFVINLVLAHWWWERTTDGADTPPHHRKERA